MLVRALLLLFAFGAAATNAAIVDAQVDVADIYVRDDAAEDNGGIPDAATFFDGVTAGQKPTASADDNTRNISVTKGGFCGVHLSDEEFVRAEGDFKRLVDSGKSLAPTDGSTLSARVTVIPVYWHVIYTSGNKGVIPKSLIYSNINALNAWYKNTNLQFKLVQIDYTFSPIWFNYASIEYFAQWTNMGKFTRRGNARTLNLWSSGMTYSNYIGYARFPYEYRNYPYNDGAILRYDQLASGKLIVHEVGHWVGLFHTFQGGCSGTGDSVADTPASASPTSGCPASRDSCTGGGLDPIHNHMDYSSDNCRYQFTYGQVQRMRQQCYIYRGLVF